MRAGGGLLVANERFSAEWVRENLLPLLVDADRLARMAAAAAGTGARDAGTALAGRVLAIATTHRGQD